VGRPGAATAPAGLTLAEQIEHHLAAIIDAGDEAKRRGYSLPDCAASGVVQLNVMAAVVRGQEHAAGIAPAGIGAGTLSPAAGAALAQQLATLQLPRRR